jgi:hypothetical protein
MAFKKAKLKDPLPAIGYKITPEELSQLESLNNGNFRVSPARIARELMRRELARVMKGKQP